VNRPEGRVLQERARGAEEKGAERHGERGERGGRRGKGEGGEGEGGGDGTRGLDEKGW